MRKIKYKYGDKALSNIRSLPMVTLLFEWTPGMPVRVNEDYNYEDDPILPEWYLNQYADTKR